MPKVDSPKNTLFCSYARVDHARVLPIAEQLRESDFNVWIDIEDIRPAVEWLREVEAAIADAAAFVLFLSPAYVGSEVCRHEAMHARTDGKKIVPVLLEPCGDLADLRWVADLNWIDATAQDATVSATASILSAASTNPEWQDAHRRLLLRAREWDSAKRTRSQLMRGDDIGAAQAALAASRLPGDPQPVALQHEFVAASVRHRSRIRRAIASAAAGVTVLSLALSAVAVVQRNTATAERASAEEARAAAVDALTESERLQAEAEARVLANAADDEPDPVWSTLYAIEALYRTPEPLPEAVEAWLTSSRRYSELILTPTDVLTLADDERALSISPSGDAVLIRTSDTSAAIIDLAGEVIVDDITFDGFDQWHPTGDFLAYHNGSSVSLVDRNGLVTQVTGSNGQHPIGWSPDGTVLTTFGDNDDGLDELMVFELVGGGEISFIGGIPIGFTIPRVSWSADSRYFSISSVELYGDFPDPYSQIVDAVSGYIGGQTFGSSGEPRGQVGFQRTQGGWNVLVGLSDGGIDLIAEDEFLSDAPAGISATGFTSGNLEVTSFSASSDGWNIAVGRADGSLNVNGAEVVTGDETGSIRELRWHPSDVYVLGASTAGRIIVSDANGRLIGQLPGRVPSEEPIDLRWSDDGRSITVAWPNGDLTSYSFEPFPPPLTVSNDALTPVVWSPSGDRVAVVEQSGDVSILRADGTPTGVRYRPADAGVFEEARVWEIVWSPIETHLAIEYLSGGFAAVSTETPLLVGSIEMRWTGPRGISWAPDGSHVATVGFDSTPNILSLDGEWTTTINSIPELEVGVGEVRFTSDGRLAIQTYDDETIIYNVDGSERFSVANEVGDSLRGGTTAPLLLLTQTGLQIIGSDGPIGGDITSIAGRPVWPTWSSSGNLLALTENDYEVAVFDAEGDEVNRVTIPARQPISRTRWATADDRLITHHANGDTWVVDLGADPPAVVELGLSAVSSISPSSNGRDLVTIASDGAISFRTSVQPAELCEELLGFVDEASFVTALSELSSQRVCIPGAELAEITTAPTSLHRPTTSSVTEATGDPEDLSVIASSYDGEHLVLGPISVGDTSFAFSGDFQNGNSNELAVWEFNGQTWVKDPTLLEPGGFYPFIVGLDELDVDSDGVSEVLVRFAPNDFVGVVLRYTAGVWIGIGSGENLEYIPGDGLYGVGNDCDPSCAEGSPIYYTLVWDGTELVSERTD